MKKVLFTLLSMAMIVAVSCTKENENSNTNIVVNEPIIISTSSVTNISYYTVKCGGNIIDNGGDSITARGVCWGTSANLSVDGSHTVDGSGDGVFISNITNLTPNTTYYVCAYAKNSKGIAYGNLESFTTKDVPEGALPFAFSVSSNKKVWFSKGNLEYSTSGTHVVAGGGTAQGTWRFAPNQYYYVGQANNNISSSYTGWIDLFGWGTSGYNNKFPYMSTTEPSDYGNGANSIAGTNYDWGVYNSVSNGGNRPGLWRMLTYNEYSYLISGRQTATGLRYAKATVNGVFGLIILPDNWDSTIYHLRNPNTIVSAFTPNVISGSDWRVMENEGAAFLPVAGMRYSTHNIWNAGTKGYYWFPMPQGNDKAWGIELYSEDVIPDNYGRENGFSVRLVQDVR